MNFPSCENIKCKESVTNVKSIVEVVYCGDFITCIQLDLYYSCAISNIYLILNYNEDSDSGQCVIWSTQESRYCD